MQKKSFEKFNIHSWFKKKKSRKELPQPEKVIYKKIYS